MGGVPSRIFSIFRRKDPRTPVKGILPRIKNMLFMHYRGILGVVVPLALLSWRPKKGEHHITVGCLWVWMAWFFLLQPVNIPVVGFIPLFLLPMAGVMPTVDVCKCYFDDNVALFVLAGMINLLLNSCGADKRIIMWLLCSGDSCQFSGKRLIFKASAAAFFLSMTCNRLIVTSTIIQYLTPPLTSLETSSRSTEPNYKVLRHIVICSVQSASSIGSIAVLHASFSTLAMRAIWSRHPAEGEEFPDIFNYLQYTCFAFPVAFLMFILNFSYHMLLVNWCVGKPMSGNSMAYMRTALLEQNKALKPYLTGFQKSCIFFYFAYLAACMFRWCDWLNMGWSGFKTVVPEVPLIKDATVAAIFVILLHILPKTFLFTNYVTARVKSDIGSVLKPDSPVMWWRYIDKNTNYGYIILIGGAIALNVAIRVSKLNEKVPVDYGQKITNTGWLPSVFIVCIIAALLPNMMSGVAAVASFLPFVLHMALPKAAAKILRQDPPAAEGGDAAPAAPAGPVIPDTLWSSNFYLGALIVGIGSSLGFAFPFLYTPAYFCHYTGKVPKREMVKYAVGSMIICILVLWVAISFYAPVIWVNTSVGIKSYVVVTAAPPAAGEAAPAEPPPAGP